MADRSSGGIALPAFFLGGIKMTLYEAIGKVDELCPNQYGQEQKFSWLSVLDGKIYLDLFMTHKANAVPRFHGYADADPNTTLLVGYPYAEEVYINYLQAKIAQENGETVKYNNAISLFNAAYAEFAQWYHKTHPAIGVGRFRF